MDLGLSGKRALVTGGTRGIGRATVELLAAEGASVAFCARGAEAVEAFAEELRGQGVTVFARAIDVSKEDELKGFIRDAAEALGGLDILVSNVTGGSLKGPEQWQQSLELDLLPLVHLIDEGTPILEAAGGGSIIALSSTFGFDNVWPSSPNSYGAFKAAIVRPASAAAQALAPKGIRVNTVSPGPVYFEDGDWGKIKAWSCSEVYEKVLSSIKLGGMGKPEEVAAVIVSLASPAFGYCVGTNVVCDGGMTVRTQFDRTRSCSDRGGAAHATSGALRLLAHRRRTRRRRPLARRGLRPARAARPARRARCGAMHRAQRLLRDRRACGCRRGHRLHLRCPASAEEAGADRRRRSGMRLLGLHATNSAIDRLSPGGPRLFRTPDVMPGFTALLGNRFLAHPRIAPARIDVVQPSHPLVAGVPSFVTTDEVYVMALRDDLEVLLDTEFEGECPGFEVAHSGPRTRHPILYSRDEGDGRVLYFTLGHCRGRFDVSDLGVADTGVVDRVAWDSAEYRRSCGDAWHGQCTATCGRSARWRRANEQQRNSGRDGGGAGHRPGDRGAAHGGRVRRARARRGRRSARRGG